jgi:N-acetylated-alpha-linked acidic dipeptidase
MNARRLSASLVLAFSFPLASAQSTPAAVFGYADFTNQARIEQKFLSVPDAKLAGRHLKTLTAAPHMAATPEDKKTADYVAKKFRAAGLETEIVPYRVLLNWPKAVRIEAYDDSGKLLMTGPTREHVDGDPYQDDPRVVMPFNGSSASGDVTGQVVYANYGRLEDFDLLAARHIDLHGKIVLCRYGQNFRGIKVYLAQLHGAAGVLIYSDPQDDGFTRGAVYPNGPWRPATGVQRGSVQFLSKYSGDPETPGIASTLDLPDSARLSSKESENQPDIVSVPISYHDAEPILRAMTGPDVPQGWQGGLPFPYHLGQAEGGVRVHLVSQQDYQRRIIWDVIGKIPGSEFANEWVVTGNHRDAWVYGAVDPSSGTAAMLEAVHAFGALVKHGWHPRRTIVFCSWDAEEQGLIGSTEWVEQLGETLKNAVAYFNVDVAVAGPDFSASAVPSLRQYVRDVARSVPSPGGGTVYQRWKDRIAANARQGAAKSSAASSDEVRVGDLGSGSDYTPFFQHQGVPSTDISSGGPYGVYHSAFDDYAWFIANADPKFVYLRQMAQVLGLEALRMADADVLPYDYVTYATDISDYIEAAKTRAAKSQLSSLDFGPALSAATGFSAAAEKMRLRQLAVSGNAAQLNLALRQVETALLIPEGLPNRPWYKHVIFAPGEYTGYAAVELPGVTEAIEQKNAALTAQQLNALAGALQRATSALATAP